MSHVSCKTGARYVVIGLALGGLAISSVFTAKAGGLDLPVYGVHPYPTPVERDGLCRILLERRVDPYGREIVHRIRICDEGPVYLGPNSSVAPQEYGYPSRRYYEPAPSYYYSYPRPPAPIGPTYYN
jgi:hypothetical protein